VTPYLLKVKITSKLVILGVTNTQPKDDLAKLPEWHEASTFLAISQKVVGFLRITFSHTV